MGRPLRKQNFGTTDGIGPQLLIRADIGIGEEDCWIDNQPGSRTYIVFSLAGGTFPTRTGRIKLQQGVITAEGQARISVTPFDGVANVQATADVFNTAGIIAGFFNLVGGSGYSVAPAIIISGGGGEGATATTTITNGSVTTITITNSGSGYFGTPVFIIDPPAAGGVVEYTRTLLQHTVKTWEGNAYRWKLGVTASAAGAATLPSA